MDLGSGIGDIVELEVLGALCLVDQGELDWKIVTLNKEEAQKVKHLFKGAYALENKLSACKGIERYQNHGRFEGDCI